MIFRLDLQKRAYQAHSLAFFLINCLLYTIKIFYPNLKSLLSTCLLTAANSSNSVVWA